MSLSRMIELVSQAEREGITLAAMMSREMSPEEMELVQDELALHLSDNYAKIESYMAGISVPSLEEILSRGDDPASHIGADLFDILSDDEEAEEETS